MELFRVSQSHDTDQSKCKGCLIFTSTLSLQRGFLALRARLYFWSLPVHFWSAWVQFNFYLLAQMLLFQSCMGGTLDHSGFIVVYKQDIRISYFHHGMTSHRILEWSIGPPRSRRSFPKTSREDIHEASGWQVNVSRESVAPQEMFVLTSRLVSLWSQMTKFHRWLFIVGGTSEVTFKQVFAKYRPPSNRVSQAIGIT